MTPIFQSALRHLASLYDMPELLTADIADTGFGTLSIKTNVSPRGQIAAMVNTLMLAVTFVKGEYDLYKCRLEMSYTHHNGGSNGKTMDYTVLTECKCGQDEFVTMVETDALKAIAARILSQ